MRALKISAIAAGLVAAGAQARADDWLPVTPEELHMTEEPKAPRAPAIYLYHQVDRDDSGSDERVYIRLKILTDEGRKYGNVEIPFNAEQERIVAIEARTIRPDGTIARFDGKIYDTPIIKARGVRYLAKTFTLGEVQAGSIVEYRFRRHLSPFYIFDSHWILNDDLFTRHGKYTLVKNPYFTLAWSWPEGLPPGSPMPAEKRGRIELETHDVPAFVTEEYMPPENTLKQRVDFVYSVSTRATDFDHFWAEYSRDSYHEIDSFVDHKRAMEKALATIVAPGDSPETKRRKVYDRVQRMRNLNFDTRAEADEALHEKSKSNHDAADVWEHGYGTGDQLTWLFLALLRAAGMEADPVYVSSRDTYFFNPKTQNAAELNTNVVRVHDAGNDLWFDPGSAYVPYGLLPWQETGVTGLILAKKGVTWITTPTPPAADSRIEHKAVLHLSDRGSLEGHVKGISTLPYLRPSSVRIFRRM